MKYKLRVRGANTNDFRMLNVETDKNISTLHFFDVKVAFVTYYNKIIIITLKEKFKVTKDNDGDYIIRPK